MLVVLLGNHVARRAPNADGGLIETVAARRPLTRSRTVLPVLGHGGRDDAWLRVRLPGRPNGHTGWIAAARTRSTSTPWRIVVSLSARRVFVFRSGRVVREFPAIVGKASTPTPRGTFFVEEALRLSPSAPGAPFALATSDRSNVLQEFDGGPGQIALHGTDNLSGALGTAASHGCIRLAPRAIAWLARAGSAPESRCRSFGAPSRYGFRVDGDARLSSSFGAAAVAYAEHRPDYAAEAVRWALEAAPGRRVLDLGAGTGKLTAGLLAAGAEVTAVEPDPEMLGELHRALPDVRALAGGAEAIPLADGSVDAVVAGNAMHWFDMDVAGPEIARVLTPGGTLAGLWNTLDDRVDWIAGLAEVSGSTAIGPRDTPAPWRAETATMHLPRSGAPARFDSPEQAEFPHGQPRTADSLVATLATRAGVLVMPEGEREELLSRIRAYLASRPETAHGEFTLPMLTCVLRVRASGDQTS